jgi:delta(3,5)-delta(2,4)-dienoyl-CoA isomerase
MSQRAGYEKYKHFLVTEPSEYVTLVQTNEPKKFNSFHEPMWLELGALFKQLGHDSGVRAVVFTAVGDKAFTAGLDVKAASQGGVLSGSKSDLDIARQGVTLRRHILEFQDCVSSLERCEKRKFVPSNGGVSWGTI